MKNRKDYVIHQLNKMGVYATKENTPLELLDYKALKYLLAVEQAVRV